ncbi:hypothetical protein D3C78_1274780 [compost metagenome]
MQIVEYVVTSSRFVAAFDNEIMFTMLGLVRGIVVDVEYIPRNDEACLFVNPAVNLCIELILAGVIDLLCHNIEKRGENACIAVQHKVIIFRCSYALREKGPVQEHGLKEIVEIRAVIRLQGY